MIHNLVCDSCKTEFNVDDEKLLKVTEGDIEVQYFECPKCERKYIVFTTNERMRELVEKRRLLAAQIILARSKRFRPSTINGYLKKMQKLKEEQLKLRTELAPIGQKILFGENDSKESGTENDTVEIKQTCEPERTDSQDRGPDNDNTGSP